MSDDECRRLFARYSAWFPKANGDGWGEMNRVRWELIREAECGLTASEAELWELLQRRSAEAVDAKFPLPKLPPKLQAILDRLDAGEKL